MRAQAWRLLTLSAAALGLWSCTGPQEPPPVSTPPSVFLVAPQSNVVGRSFKVRVNVTGCEKVEQLQLEQSGEIFKTATFRGANTEIEVMPGDLARFYGTVGIAADLTLRARAICNDGRENRSQAVGIKFFPVANVVEPTGAQAIIMPDSFVAEGGVNATPVTFIGCANTSLGLSLVRLDLAGQVVGINQSPLFPCDYYATITAKVSGGLRWLYQADKGAFAFDQNLDITGGLLGDAFGMFWAAPDGDALIWESSFGSNNSFKKLRRDRNPATGQNIAWATFVPGLVNGEPAIDPSTGLVMVPSWRVPLTAMELGNQTIQYVDYQTGQVTGQRVLVSQRFELFEAAKPPFVAFSPDGRTIYIPVPVQGAANQSAVIACGTQGGGSGCTPRWRTVNFDGLVRYIIPFANGSKVAAIADDRVWFIDESSVASTGMVLNPGGLPTAVSGQLSVSGVQTGSKGDFYLLAGTPFATEIIAFDDPSNGEVWRYSFQGGDAPQNAITMAIDDSGAAWLRIGVNQVRPLALTEYRNVRGATVPGP
jgi:hypothetical protein